jgi:hypothetical protein
MFSGGSPGLRNKGVWLRFRFTACAGMDSRTAAVVASSVEHRAMYDLNIENSLSQRCRGISDGTLIRR